MAHQRGNEEGIMDYSKFHEGFLSLVRVLACIETGGARMKIFHRRYHAFVHSHLHTPFVRRLGDVHVRAPGKCGNMRHALLVGQLHLRR